MSKNINEYITRVNKILSESNSNKTNINNGAKQNNDVVDKIKNKKKENSTQLKNYQTFEQFESLLNRAVILHTEGIYIQPPEAHNCIKKKKRKIGGKKFDRGPDAKMPNTRFGSGRIGVSCESYGVKNCTCCDHRNYEDILHIQNDLLFKKPNKIFHKAPLDFIDLTKTTIFDGASSSKKLNDSVISISDSSPNSSLIIDPDEIIILDDDDNSPKNTKTKVIIKTENVDLTNTVSKTENTSNTNLDVYDVASVDNITENINLASNNYNEDEMRKNEDHEKTIDMEIKSEILDTSIPNHANVDNIFDYINLVTSNYDEDVMRKYEDELAETIHATDFELLRDTSTNKTENVPNKDVPQKITNTEIESKSNTENVKKTIQTTVSSPVPSKSLSQNSSQPEISCPICLENILKKEAMSTICGHLFCAECIKKVIKKTKNCPNCRKKLSLKSIHPIFLG